MKATLTRQYLKSFLILFLLVSTGTFAQTRLSVFFTQEEVNIWKQRAANGPYKSLGDAQANSPGDWTRIMNNANAFVSNPLAERWKGVITNTCVQVGANEPALLGKKLRDAAFAYLITGNTNFRNAVRTELLGQIKEPYADFSVRTRWCDGVLRDAPPSYPICDWMIRLYFAYSCIRPTLTDTERSQIENWFYNAAVFFQRNIDADLSKLYVNRNAGDWNMSNYGRLMNTTLGRTTHYNGYKTSSLGRHYNNRRSSQVIFYTLFGIDQNIAVLKNSGKLFVKEYLMFNIYPDGTSAEFERWEERLADKGFNYVTVTASQVANIADYFARSGDFELYNFTTSRGLYGTQGGNKNISLVVKMIMNYLDGTIKRYGTGDPALNGASSHLIEGINGTNWRTINDTWFAQSNIYYKNSYVKSSYTRTGSGTKAYPTSSTTASIGMHKPYGGAWDVYPGVLFMYGQMDGKVWPYPGSVVNPSLAIAVSTQAAKCYGGSEGSASVSVSGGVAPYTYLWSTGATTSAVSGLKAGEYTVVVTDKAGVKQSKSMVITQPLAINITKAIVNETATAKGSISLTVSGGTAPYSYKWSTGATTKDVSGLVAGTYTITVTDAHTCSVSQSITISRLISPLALTVTAKPVTCSGSSNGSAIASVTGGVAPYSYAWSTGATTSALTGLKAGEYTVTVTDQKGVKTSKTLTITQPSAIAISETVVDETATAKGSISLSVSGGTAPYSYKWSTGATSKDLSSVAAGTYSVTITDANNCIVFKSIEIEKSSPVSMAVLSLSLMNADTDEVIRGYSTLKDGDTLELATLPTRKLNIRANTTDPNKIMKVRFGLNGNPEHRIDRFSPYSLDGDFRGDFEPWKLTIGTYSVSVSPYDSSHVKGTELKLTFHIIEKKSTPLVVQTSAKQNTCNGLSSGSASVSVSGGVAPYTYLWSTGATTSALTGLKAGEYSVTVTDKNGAKVSKTLTITQPSAIAITETVVHQTAAAKGSISLSVSGGTAPYKYKWSNNIAAKDLTGIVAGSYSVTVTDASNCSVTKTIVVEKVETQVAVQSLSLVNADTKSQITGYAPLQNGDTLDLTTLPTRNLNIIANTTDPKDILKVKFKLNSNENYRIERSSPYLLEGNDGKNYHAWKLKPGKYTLTATAYDKGHKNGRSVTVTFHIVEGKKKPLVIAIDGSNIGCNGTKGAAAVIVSGGKAPYKYKWSTGATTSAVSGLKSGEYSVTVTDKNGAKVSKTLTITQPLAIAISEKVVHQTAAAKGSISLSVSGGTAPYSYKWSTGATSKDLSSVAAGTYSVTITDDNNCSVSETFNVQSQAEIAINLTSSGVTCSGSSNGSAKVTVSGGVSPYSYKWSTGATSASVSGLKAGEYTVTVTDKNGAKVSKTLTITQPLAIAISEKVVHQTAAAKGSISLSVSGGTAPYKYKWSNNIAAKDLTGIVAGSYSITVTDASNCSVTKTIVVEKAEAQVAVVSLSLINAATDKVISAYATLKDGDVLELATLPTRKLSIQANTSDPKDIKKVQFSLNNTIDYHRDYSSPYFIASNDGANVKPWNITPGKYTLTATPYDNDLVKGKTVTITFEIVERKNNPFLVQINAKHNLCYNAAQGSATITVSGGVSPYSYKWSTGATTSAVSGLKAGEYTVTVTDKNGVKVSKTLTITQPSAIAISEKVVHQTAAAKGSISLSVSGGTAPYSYKWSTGATSKDLSSVAAGTYSVTITDDNNCTVTKKIEVRNSDNKGNEITPIVDCVLDNGDGTFTATFGYLNASAEKITLTAGNSNFFAPAPVKGDVPETFLPGKNTRAFTAIFKKGTSLTWTIIGQDGTKRIAVASANTARCLDIEPATITLKPSYLFSPNEDGIDDLWVINNIEQHPDYEVIIFNRNGNKVFQAKPYTNNWDGRYQGVPLMAEAYYYVIRSATQGNIKTGTVTLIR